MDATDLGPIRASLLAERDRLARGDRRGDRRARTDDLWIAGRGREPGLRPAARPRPARPVRPAARRSSTRRSPGSTPGRSGPASAAGARSVPTGSRRCRGPPAASTASASPRAIADDHRRPTPPWSALPTSAPRPTDCEGIALRTPLVAFGPSSGRRFLKAESLQPIGAFKLRGAYATIASLSREELARGVITYSSGNHAQGVARAARLLGAPAVVVMPSDAPGSQARAGRSRTGPRSSSSGPPATNASRSPRRSPLGAASW